VDHRELRPCGLGGAPSRALPNAFSVTIGDESTGYFQTARVRDGGLDPWPVSAAWGDQLQLRVMTDSGAVVGAPFGISVTGSKGPVVIRTAPSSLRRDVPLNAVILIVFSEPLSPASITRGTVSLTSAGAPVSGQLSFSDSAHVAVLFSPDAPLARRPITPSTSRKESQTPVVKPCVSP